MINAEYVGMIGIGDNLVFVLFQAIYILMASKYMRFAVVDSVICGVSADRQPAAHIR